MSTYTEKSERSQINNPMKLSTSGSCHNPSYAGSRDQEDHGLKPSGAYLKKTFHKKGLV
jgi:hypothetical protein